MKLQIKFFVLAVLFITQVSCYEKKQGCLDIYAANYDFAADVTCDEDCCKYPNLRINLSHNFDSVSFKMRETFMNNLGHSFIILNQKFYLSDISLFTSRDKVALENKENVSLTNGNDENIEINYKLIRDVITSATVNQIKAVDSVERIKLVVGLTNYFNDVNVASVTSSSELSVNTGMVDSLDKYYSYFARVICGDSLKDTINIFTYDNFPFEKNINPSFKQIPGSEVVLNLNLNYYELFKNVDFKSADVLKINAILNKNLAAFLE